MIKTILTAVILASGMAIGMMAETIQPKEANISDCKGTRSEEPQEEEQTLWGHVQYSDGILTVTWLDYFMECCPELHLSLRKESPNVLIFDTYGSTGLCDCLCTYDITGSFEDITPGHYVLKLAYGDNDFLTQEIDVEEGCNISLMKAPSGIQTVESGNDVTTLSANGILHIETTGKTLVEIYDTSGNIRSRINVTANGDIDINTLPKGLYVAKVTVDGLASSLRFIK